MTIRRGRGRGRGAYNGGCLVFVVAGLAALILACGARAQGQQFPPFNVEFHQGVHLDVIRQGYQWKLLAIWQPSVSSPFLTLHPTGVQMHLTIQDVGFLHRPEWTGQCPTRIVRGPYFSGPLHVWPGIPANPSFYLGGYALDLFTPGMHSIEYGNFFGGYPCQFGQVVATMPEWAAIIFTVRE